MKTIQNLAKSTVVALTILFSSCSKDSAPLPTPAPAASKSFITAKVEGVDFTTNIFGASSASASRSQPDGIDLIQILGTELSANSIAITLIGVTTTGTYTIDPSTDGSVLAYTPSSGGISFGTGGCAGSGGTLVVTYIDNKKIEGTFSFVGKDVDHCETAGTKTITNGSFRGVFVN